MQVALKAHTDYELCLGNLREQLPGILQLLPSVSQDFHFSVSFLENNCYFKNIVDWFVKSDTLCV